MFAHELISSDPDTKNARARTHRLILFHRTGVMRSFARSVKQLVIEGLSLSSIEQYIRHREHSQ